MKRANLPRGDSSEGETLARLILATISNTAKTISAEQASAFTEGLSNALASIGVELHNDSESVEGALTALRRVVALRGFEDKLESLEAAFTGVGTSFELSAAELTKVGSAFERTADRLGEQLAAAQKISRSIEESADRLVLGLQAAGQGSRVIDIVRDRDGRMKRAIVTPVSSIPDVLPDDVK